MKRLLKNFFLINLLVGLIFIDLTWADTEKKNSISVEKASEILDNLPELKNLKEKYLNLVGHGVGIGVKDWPREDFPFYIMSISVSKEIEKSPGVYEAQDILSRLFYIDAYTGEVYSEEAMQKKTLAMKEAQRLREKQEAEQREKEKSFKVELERIYTEISKKRWQNKDEYNKLVRESLPLFLKALGAVTPDIRAGGVRFLSQLVDSSAELKQAIPRLIELLKDDDYGIRYEAAVALGDKGNKDLVESILPLIKDSDSLVRRGAISALSRLGDNSLTPVLINLLGDSSVNQEAVKALIQVGDERALEPLLLLFNNKDYFYLEKDIVYALGQAGRARSIPALIELLGKEYTRDTKYHGDFEPVTPYIGVDAGQVLAKIGKDSVPYLLQTLQAKDYLTRLYSVYGLNLIKDQSSLNSLKDALVKEDNPTVKIYIEKAIAEIEGRTFTAPAANLGVRIESSKQKYKLKEEINLFLCIENKESIPVIINTAAIFEDIFRVTGPDGKPVDCLTKWHRTDFPTKGSLITLNPGQTHKAGLFSIQEDYSFTALGRYQIIGIYENRFNAIEFGVYAWVGRVESQAITIEVE